MTPFAAHAVRISASFAIAIFAALAWMETSRLDASTPSSSTPCVLLPTASVNYLATLDPRCPLRPYERIEAIQVDGSWLPIGHRSDLVAATPGSVQARVASGVHRREIELSLSERRRHHDSVSRWGRVLFSGAALVLTGSLLARSTGPFSLPLGAMIAVLIAYATSPVLPRSTVLDALWISVPGVLAASATHLALVFPRERRILERFRGLVVIPYVVAALVILVEWVMLRNRSEFWELPDRILSTWAVAAGTVLAASSALALAESDSLREYRLAGLLVYASAALVSLAVMLSIGVGSSLPLMPRRTVAFVSALVLGAFGYAIARHGNIDTPRLVRWWTSYVLYAALVASGAWVAALVGRHHWGWPRVHLDPPVFLGLTFVFLLGIDALRRIAWSLSEEWVTPWAPRLERVREGFLRKLLVNQGPEEVVGLLVDAIRDALDARSATGFLRLDSRDWRLASARGERTETELAQSAEKLLRELEQGGVASTTLLLREVIGQRRSALVSLRQAGVSLVAALPGSDGWRGLVVVGPLRGEHKVSSDHLALVDQLCRHAGIAIQKAELEQEILVQARLAGVGFAAAGLAHDLGRPLGEIYLEARSSNRPNASEIQRLAGDCIDLLERFLEESKGGRGGPSGEIPLALILETAAERIDQRHPGRRPVLRLAPHLPVVAHARDIQRVIEELIDNAVKWSPAGQPIEVVATSEADGLEVRVIDHGRGMDEEVRRRAFEPFFSGRSSSGLGLTICRDIARRLGGSIQLESTAAGGTVASLRLPGAS
jgi:signal transduction histidine kinase